MSCAKPSTLPSKLSDYLTVVQELGIATNNSQALASDLQAAYSGLAGFQAFTADLQLELPVWVLNAPANVECQGVVTRVRLDGSGSRDPGGFPLSFTWSTDRPSNVFDDSVSPTPTLSIDSSKGPTVCTVTLTVINSFGLTSTCSTTITVEDTTPPTITKLISTPNVLWPPNRKMVSVRLTVEATDNCGVTECKIIQIRSSEREGWKDPRKADRDWEVTGNLTLLLRAERSGEDRGRTYTITVQCRDASGNTSSKDVVVTVPHDQDKKHDHDKD